MISTLLIMGAIVLIAYVVYRSTAKPRDGQATSLGLLAYKEEVGPPPTHGRPGPGGPRA